MHIDKEVCIVVGVWENKGCAGADGEGRPEFHLQKSRADVSPTSFRILKGTQ